MDKPPTPLWLWPVAALVGLLVAWLTIGFEPHLFEAEALAGLVTIAVGIAGRWWWRRHSTSSA